MQADKGIERLTIMLQNSKLLLTQANFDPLETIYQISENCRLVKYLSKVFCIIASLGHFTCLKRVLKLWASLL